MRHLLPKLLAAAVLLVPLAGTAEAAESTVEGSLGYYSLRDQGTQEKAREYDGRELGSRENREGDKLEADIKVTTDFGPALLILEGTGIRSGSEDVSLDYTYGSKLRLRGSFSGMTHRWRDTQMGVVYAGHYYSMAEAASGASPIVGAAYNTNNAEHQEIQFRREIMKADLVLRDKNCPVWFTVGLWNEHEYGQRIARYYNHNIWARDTNRYTRDVKGSVQTTVGENGYLGYEIVGRRFEELRPSVRTAGANRNYGSLSEPGNPLGINPVEIVSGQSMLKNTVTGSYRFANNLNAAFGVSRRSRKHAINAYERTMHSAHFGLTHKPSKNWALSGRFYGRAEVTDETEHIFNPSSTQSTAESISKKDALDRYNYRANLKARYSGFKGVKLSFGYKPSHTFRRNAGTWIERDTFNSNTIFHDGTGWQAFEINNPTEAKDTKHEFNAKVAFDLPNNAQLTVAAKEMFANRGGYQAMPRRVSNQTVDVSVPFTDKLYGSLTGGMAYSANMSNSFKRFRRLKHFVLVGSGYTGAKGSFWAHYGWDKDRNDMNFHWGEGRTNDVHINAPNVATNHTFSLTANRDLTENMSFDANGAYTYSIGNTHVINAFLPGSLMDEGLEVENIEPVAIQILRWGIGVNYALKKDLTARVGFDQSVYIDQLLGTDTGQSQLYTAKLSAKF